MQTDPKIYKPGQWVILGAALGGFVGLLVGKFAIGLIFGFFVGVFVDSAKRKAAKADGQSSADQGPPD